MSDKPAAPFGEVDEPKYPTVHKWPVPHPLGKPVAEVVGRRDYDALKAAHAAAVEEAATLRNELREYKESYGRRLNADRDRMAESMKVRSVVARHDNHEEALTILDAFADNGVTVVVHGGALKAAR